MKVLVSAQAGEPTAGVDPRFGRAAWFVLVDTETGDWSAHNNRRSAEAARGSGTQAARAVSDLGAGAVITGNVGPNAFRALDAAGIAIYLTPSGTVAEAVQRLQEGKLKKAAAATR